MIIDTSVLIGILRGEDAALDYYETLILSQNIYIPAPALLEAKIVAKNKNVLRELEELLEAINATTLAFTEDMAAHAFEGYSSYGKGQGHPAQLNFGDCLVYGTVKSEDLPLLYIGNDFAQTDLG